MSRILGFDQDPPAEGIKMNMKIIQGGVVSFERTPWHPRSQSRPDEDIML
jgi:hypothetical protein